MREERVELMPEGTGEAGVLARVPVHVGKRRPVVRADRMRLDKHEVPFGLGIAIDRKRQRRPVRRNGDRSGETLVRGISLLRERILLARARGGDGEELGIDRVPVADARDPVGAELELPHRRRREVGGHRRLRIPYPGRPATPRPGALESPVGDGLEAGRDGNAKGVGGLVERMVVRREPGRRHVRFTGDKGAVVGRDEAADAEGVHDRRRDPMVTNDSLELLARR